jgi:spore coat protein CotF
MPETRDLNEARTGYMTEADRLHDCLCSSKERAKLYANAALECTNNGVREFFLAMHGEETHNQEILFSFLHTRGYYPVKMASKDAVNDVRERFLTMHQELGITDSPSFRRYRTADPEMPPAHLQNNESFEYKGDAH